MTRALLLVLALSFHLVSIVVVCIFVGDYLDRRAPLAALSWLAITFVVGILLIAQNYYVFFRYMLRQEKKGRDDDDS